MLDICGAWGMLNALTTKPYRKIECNGKTVEFLCDTRACKTVLTQVPPNTNFTEETIMIKCANGKIARHRVTKNINMTDPETGRNCKIPVIIDPQCPVPLLGRDAMLALKLYVTPVRGGMVAKALSDEDSEGVYNAQMTETIYFSYEVDTDVETWLKSKGSKTNRPSTDQNERLHLTMRVGGENDLQYVRAFLAHDRVKFRASYLLKDMAGNMWLQCDLEDTERPLFQVPNSVPHVSIEKATKSEWKDMRPRAKRATMVTDWHPTPSFGDIEWETSGSTGLQRVHLKLTVLAEPKIRELKMDET